MSSYDGEAAAGDPGHAPAGARSRAPPIRWSRCWKAWCSAAPARRSRRSASRWPARPAPPTKARDVWFVGFSPDLVAGVYLGFDQPRSLGEKATGGGYSAPIFRDFMMEALKDEPATPFRVPPGIRLVRVDYYSGAAGRARRRQGDLGSLQAGHRADRPRERHPGRRQLRPGCRLRLDHSDRSRRARATRTRAARRSSIPAARIRPISRPAAPPAQDGQPVITGDPTDEQPNLLPPGITPSGERRPQALQQAEQPQQPALQAPAVGEAPAAPAQPAPPAAPATDSSGGIY